MSVICEGVGLYIHFAPLWDPGDCIFYTIDSNLLCLAVGFIFAVLSVIFIIRRKPLPFFMHILRYAVTLCLAITMVVVLTVLIPFIAISEKKGDIAASLLSASVQMLGGNMFLLHFFCPLISLFSFILFENSKPLPLYTVVLSLLPTLIYAAALVPLNITGYVNGPYFFLCVYDRPVWMSCIWALVILGLSAALSFGIRALHNIPFRKR